MGRESKNSEHSGYYMLFFFSKKKIKRPNER